MRWRWPWSARGEQDRARLDDRPERWSRPLTFTVDVPPEWQSAGGPSLHAPRVSRAEAMSVPAVKRVRDLIAGTLGTLPAEQLDAGRRPVPSVLLTQPERDVARSVTFTRLVEDLLFEQVAWWRVTEFGADGFPEHVERVEPNRVRVQQGAVYVDGVRVDDGRIIRFDSPNDAMLVCGARAIRACLALERTAARYADDPMPLGYFAPRGDVEPADPDEIEEMLDDWEDARARRTWGYVNGALEAKALTWNPEQLQLASARDTAILEIARIGGVDPEELGVSTTSRTYANAEQRRLDLLDFTLLAYVTAIEGRLSMPDVVWPTRTVWFAGEGFLRSDTLSRMQVYEIGMRLGIYTPERVARLERVPSVRPLQPAAAAAPAPAAPAPDAPPVAARRVLTERTPPTMAPTATPPAPPVRFSVEQDAADVRIGFALEPGAAKFAADPVKRTVSGTVIPWGSVAYSRGYLWKFAPGSLHWSTTSRVKLDRDHEYGSEFGHAADLVNQDSGLYGSFKVARGPEGDRALALAEDGVYDGFSVEATFASDADGWTADPDNPNIRLVHSATLRKVALTAMPAFDDARVTSVAATTGTPGEPTMTTPAAPPAPAAPAAPFDTAAFTAGLTESLTAAFAPLFEQLPAPQRQTVQAARAGAVVTREEPVYLMNGHGHSLIRDAWRARTEHDADALERIRKFSRQTEDTSRAAMHFAIDRSNAAQVIPPGYRPDLYVTQLIQGRPLTNSVSRGTLADATPFNIPSFTSATGATSTHTEGTNPTGGSMVLGTVTVTPQAISGLFELSREIVDSANPAIDAIAMTAMQESYAQQTEGLTYSALNTAQSGVITGGLVPSGAQVRAVSGGAGGNPASAGDELLAGVRLALADYPFARFGAAERAHLSQEATQAFAGAVDTTGRPLLPWVGPQNAQGTADVGGQGYFVDGLTFVPTWSMSGNAAGDADVLMFNTIDVWAWESNLLMFRFEERGGPARIDLALYGYYATRVIRPVGVSAVRLTVTP